MVRVVRVTTPRKQNGVSAAELIHMGESFMAQVAMPVTILHHRARCVQALEVERPIARVAKQHVSITCSSTTDCAWLLVDRLCVTRGSQLLQAVHAPALGIHEVMARLLNVKDTSFGAECPATAVTLPASMWG